MIAVPGRQRRLDASSDLEVDASYETGMVSFYEREDESARTLVV